MKWIGLILVLVFLGASQATSQVPDDKLIVEGQRIGKWTLAMTIANLVQMNGPFDASIPAQGPDLARPVVLHRWNRLGLNAVTSADDTQRIEVLVAFSDEYKTGKGIAVKARRENVETAYGPPTAVTQWTPSPFSRRLTYDQIGLGVNLIEGGVVDSVGIFRPGTAKQLWKF